MHLPDTVWFALLITLIGAVGGLLLVWTARRARLLDDHPLCRRCRFDLSGTLSAELVHHVVDAPQLDLEAVWQRDDGEIEELPTTPLPGPTRDRTYRRVRMAVRPSWDSAGFAVDWQLPDGVQAEIERQVSITLKGADKALLGQVAAKLRALRKPDPYKGKGIKYAEEHIRRKVGKKAGAK